MLAEARHGEISSAKIVCSSTTAPKTNLAAAKRDDRFSIESEENMQTEARCMTEVREDTEVATKVRETVLFQICVRRVLESTPFALKAKMTDVFSAHPVEFGRGVARLSLSERKEYY